MTDPVGETGARGSGRSALERHAQTALQILVVGLLAWFGTTLQDQTVSMARLEQRVAGLERVIEVLQDGTDDRYTRADFERDRETIMRFIDDHGRRLDRLERGGVE